MIKGSKEFSRTTGQESVLVGFCSVHSVVGRRLSDLRILEKTSVFLGRSRLRIQGRRVWVFICLHHRAQTMGLCAEKGKRGQERKHQNKHDEDKGGDESASCKQKSGRRRSCSYTNG